MAERHEELEPQANNNLERMDMCDLENPNIIDTAWDVFQDDGIVPMNINRDIRDKIEGLVAAWKRGECAFRIFIKGENEQKEDEITRDLEDLKEPPTEGWEEWIEQQAASALNPAPGT